MTVYSMTGYASVQWHAESSRSESSAAGDAKSTSRTALILDIRAVNSRFLDLSLRLPDDWRSSETALREAVMGRLKRGKVEVRVTALQTATTAVPSPRLLQGLNAAQDMVRAWLPLATPLSVADVLHLAGGETSHGVCPSLDRLPLLQRALDELLAARQREGQRLADVMLDKLGQLRALVQRALPLVPQLVEQQRQRFLARWQEALALGDAGTSQAREQAQDRALSEATAFALRIDVAEEIARLRAHLDEIERLLQEPGDRELGKRLEFLIQELHREANTLGSKSAALELTRISVEMKVLIEQLREQVQNIE